MGYGNRTCPDSKIQSFSVGSHGWIHTTTFGRYSTGIRQKKKKKSKSRTVSLTFIRLLPVAKRSTAVEKNRNLQISTRRYHETSVSRFSGSWAVSRSRRSRNWAGWQMSECFEHFPLNLNVEYVAFFCFTNKREKSYFYSNCPEKFVWDKAYFGAQSFASFFKSAR